MLTVNCFISNFKALYPFMLFALRDEDIDYRSELSQMSFHKRNGLSLKSFLRLHSVVNVGNAPLPSGSSITLTQRQNTEASPAQMYPLLG